PASGHLFVVGQLNGTTQVVEINPATGAAVNSFAPPFTASGWAGLTIDPTTGDLWYGSDQSTNAVELTRAGAVVRQISLTTQGETGSVSGLSFDASGDLLVSTSSGTIYRISLGYNPAVAAPTLTAIAATALGGTPANAALASANAGQVITLTGTNFGAGTEVVFPTLDSTGVTGQTAVTPLAVSAHGTTLQVQVPTLATTGAVQVVNVGSQNLGYGASNDAIYRGVMLSFTPTASGTAALTFADAGLPGLSTNSWGIDNVVVSQGASPGGTTVFSDNFESGSAQPQWSVNQVDAADPGVFSDFLGRFSGGSDTLNLTGLTAGQSYTLTFDLYIIDNWVGTNPSGGPDTFQVSANGTTLLNAAFSNSTSDVQTFNASAGVALQIVPTLTGISGAPGSDTAFDLLGSGFMDGASTITIGGAKLVDSYANQSDFSVTGTTNADFHLTAPLTLDGPIRVTTAGGSAQLSGPDYAAQPPVQFTGIATTAQSGTPANATVASANVGQTITLTGQGFTNSTLVQFTAQDDTGAVGTVTRTGTASTDGTTLTVAVPELAKTGLVKVLGSTASYTLQIVPVVRSVGGTVASGNTIELDGSGLVGSELVIQIDGRAVGTFSVRSVLDDNDSTVSNAVNGQQLLTLTVPSGIGAGVITVTTNGGSITLHTGVTLAASTLTPASDVGDTLATAQVLTLPTDGVVTVNSTIGDGANGAKDVDLYQVTLAAGEALSVGLNTSFYSELRIFNAAGTQLATTQNGSYVSPNTTGVVEQFSAPAAGTYYVGISGYANTSYNPTTAGSGAAAAYTGTYALRLERVGAADTRLSGITAAATSGTVAQTRVASANSGQTITQTGTGLLSTDQEGFTAIDASG
ncbi:MAG: pre-peptidase C-terminal domain-containing protein, partial [Solirubrobacteraceae bacterium]